MPRNNRWFNERNRCLKGEPSSRNRTWKPPLGSHKLRHFKHKMCELSVELLVYASVNLRDLKHKLSNPNRKFRFFSPSFLDFATRIAQILAQVIIINNNNSGSDSLWRFSQKSLTRVSVLIFVRLPRGISHAGSRWMKYCGTGQKKR